MTLNSHFDRSLLVVFFDSYFPIQNFENIFSSKSSVVISPVVSQLMQNGENFHHRSAPTCKYKFVKTILVVLALECCLKYLWVLHRPTYDARVTIPFLVWCLKALWLPFWRT